ncbi:hypothetical protein VF21_10648 [Pseudogymnoascus sp. 05NY08]|nr:hypothetical protein VF21_10648 [Pseudogymnoascus sp. 05NY08]
MQRLMNDALHKYLDIFVIVYLDDVLVYLTSEQEHVKHVKLVLEKIEKYNLLLKLEKCEFYKNQVEFLDENRKFKLIAYYSRKLSPAELNYDIYDKELLAIIVAFEQWRVYLKGSTYPVQVWTDHKNLIYFTTTKVLNRRQVCWAETLAAYNFTITYRKGSENVRADALSRRTDYISPKEERPRAILKKTDAGMQYNELLATIAIVEDLELEERLKKAYATDECAKRVLSNVKGDFTIDEQGLI